MPEISELQPEGHSKIRGNFREQIRPFGVSLTVQKKCLHLLGLKGSQGKQKKVYIYYLGYINNEKNQSCSMLHLCWLSDKEKYVVRLESLLSYQSQDESAKPVEGDVICHPPDVKKWTSAWTCHHPPQTPLESMSGHSPQT